MDGNAQQWGDEVKETKAQNDELKDVGRSLLRSPALPLSSLCLELTESFWSVSRVPHQVLQEREKENDELRDSLQEHVAEINELRDKLADVEALCGEVTEKLEEHLAGCEPEKAEKDAELLANNEEIQNVSFFVPLFFLPIRSVEATRSKTES